MLNFDSSFGGQPWSLPEVEDPDNPVIAPPHRVHLLIHDFNPYTLARDRAERKRRNLRDPISSWVVRAQPDPSDEEITSASGAVPLAPEYTVTLWDAPSFTRREEFWEDDVITRLPFRTLRRGMAGRANGVMIDDQHILAIQTTDSRIMTKHDVTALCM